jgi:hypothetical protein
MASNSLTPMTENQLITVIEDYVSGGMDYSQSTLTKQISKSLKYYYGEPLGNEVLGRSAVVSKDVADAVDWIMPSLMRIFHGGKDTVQFIPETKQDIQTARQAHDYCNYVYNVENDGFVNTYSVIQDALLAKNGIMKHWQCEKIEVEFDNFTGLTQEQVEILLLEEGAELMASSAILDQNTGLQTYDVEVSRKQVNKFVKIESVPPEEFIIDTWSSCIEDASFVGHRRLVSRSDLVSMGFDPELVYSMSSESNTYLRGGNGNSITRARNGYDNAQFTNNGFNSGVLEDSQEQVMVTEGIIKVDFDGDGIAEKRRVLLADGHLLMNERHDEPLFTDFRSHIMAHKFYGLSLYDQLQDIQKIKTTLLRNLLDNMYTLNNGRYEVVDGQVNMDDLLNNRLGGVVRTKMAGAIKQLDTPPLPSQNFTMLEYLDNLKDNRTGVSNTTKGMDSSILHSNQAGSAVADVMAAAEQKQELIARILAHSFAKLFSNIYKLVTIHQDAEKVFQVRGEFVTVNPANWRKDYRITPVPGIGDGKVAEKTIAAQMMLNINTTLAQQGAEGILFDWNTVHTTLLELTQNAGFDEPHRFWLNPASPEGQQAIAKLEKAKAQPSLEEKKFQAETQLKQQELQIEAQVEQAKALAKTKELEVREREAAVKERELDLEQQKIDISRYEAELRHALGVGELQLEMQQDRAVSLGDNQVPNVRDGDLPS